MSTLKLGNIGSLVTYDSSIQKMVSHKDIEIVIGNDKIIDIGTKLDHADSFIDCRQKLVTPGFVDCHTHPVFLDSREDEFHMRVSGGLSYEEISNMGGGISSSIEGVKNASETLLTSKLKSRMDKFLFLGTTTVECKSGYGLDTKTELKSLKVIDEVNKKHNIDMIPTFMGAHDFPKKYINNKDGYVDLICDEMIPEVASQGIAKFNDVFCEKGYFSLDQSERILNVGRNYGLYPRMHADEFYNSGASKLAADLKVASADHLMEINCKGIEALASSGVVGTLLPGTTFFLGKHKYAPYKELEKNGVHVAIATDYNPGSCSIQSMPFIIMLSCIYLHMNILEAIKSSTYIAAKSLMMENEIGSIEKGKKADILIWNLSRVEEIPYTVDSQQLNLIIKNGKSIFTA